MKPAPPVTRMRFPVTRASLPTRWRSEAQWQSLAAVVCAVGAALAYLLTRLVRDAVDKPVYDDEALAGLIAARPLNEVIETVMVDRGGAPLHFVLAHVTLALDPSPVALRALSIVFAVGAVLLCYDLGRRLGGSVAGVAAALVAAGSDLLLVYGSFGRMYALFVFAAALAADLFVRALERRTAEAAAVAALAALLLPASHPYGIVPFTVEAAVALAVWRGRPLRPALPTILIGLGVFPFLVADLQLLDRFSVGLGGESLAQRRGLGSFGREVLGGFGGGTGLMLLVMIGVAATGLVLIARRSLPFALYAGGSLAASALLLFLARAGDPAPLSSRYFIFLLPVWAALVGVAVARASWLGVAVVAAVVFLAPESAVQDPRVLELAKPSRLAAPAEEIRAQVGERDVLFPYSPVYLSALPEAAEAAIVSRARPGLLLRELDDARFPVLRVFVAVPEDRSWRMLVTSGPFVDRVAVLRALDRELASLEADPYVTKARHAVAAALNAS
jgi:Dolichyl-phosphate-mannose-protein mannosyltransferase